MSKYVDVYLLPIREDKVEAYRQMAEKAGQVFRRHGALSYREYIASDLNVKEVLPFPQVIHLEEGETLIYAAVGFESEEHRNEVMKKVYEDPGMECPETPFDPKRMVYGGFKILVEA
jgi:uncharacterized protein YbaA (DUF1428 family)